MALEHTSGLSGMVGSVASSVLSAAEAATGNTEKHQAPASNGKEFLERWKAAAQAVAKDVTVDVATGSQDQMTKEEKEAAEEEGVLVVQGKDGTFETSVNTGRMADILGVDEELIIDDLNMTPLEKEQNPYTKQDLSGKETVITDEAGNRLDDVGDGNTVEMFGCEVSAKNVIMTSGLFGMNKEDATIVHVKSDYLGDFEYDPNEFALGFKELEDGSRLPVLSYIGNGDGAGNNWKPGGVTVWMSGTDIGIPDGLKSMDYMFEGNEHIEFVPPIPDSVTSMHYAFAGCSNLQYSTEPAVHYFESMPLDMPWANGSWLGNGYVVELPEGLEDMSGVFKDCGKLDVTLASSEYRKTWSIGSFDVMTGIGNVGLPSSLVNIQNAFEGCESLEKGNIVTWLTQNMGCPEYTDFPKYGGAITPYLTSHYAKDALNKITNEKAKEYADTRDYVIDDEGIVDEHKKRALEENGRDLDEGRIAESQIHARREKLKDIFEGKTDNDSELSSGGARSNNYYYNAAEDGIADDVTGLMVSDKKPSALSSIWQRAAIDGAAGLGIAGVMHKLTGSGLLSTIGGVAGAVALDYFDVLPESIVPIVRWTADKLPEGKWKEKLEDIVDDLTGSTIRDQKENLTAENVAATYQNRRLQRSIWGMKGAYELADVDKAMYNNAEYCAVNLNFKATADKALADGEAAATDGARMVARDTVSSMEALWADKEAAGEDMSSSKSEMREYYVGLMEALESYNKGAKHGMVQMTDSNYKQVSEQGLAMLNRAYASEVIGSLKEMDAKYGFMDEAAWTKIEVMGISGVDIRNIRDFDDAKAQELSAKSITAVQAVVTAAGEEYKTGIVIRPREGNSFYNENNGKFYNEGEQTRRRTEAAAQELGDAAAGDTEEQVQPAEEPEVVLAT